MKNFSEKNCKENQNTHFMFNNYFSKIMPFMFNNYFSKIMPFMFNNYFSKIMPFMRWCGKIL